MPNFVELGFKTNPSLLGINICFNSELRQWFCKAWNLHFWSKLETNNFNPKKRESKTNLETKLLKVEQVWRPKLLWLLSSAYQTPFPNPTTTCVVVSPLDEQALSFNLLVWWPSLAYQVTRQDSTVTKPLQGLHNVFKSMYLVGARVGPLICDFNCSTSEEAVLYTSMKAVDSFCWFHLV